MNKDSASYRVSSPITARACAAIGAQYLLALTLLLSSYSASAAPASPQDTQRSEELGEAGVASYEAGNLEQAKAQLEEGYRLSGWGTIGVWLAKTYDKLGLTSDAYRVYIEVASSPAAVGEAELFAQARVQAQQGADAIAATAAIVQLKSATPKVALAVSLDGKVTALTPASTLAVAPGEHTIEVVWHKGKLPPQNYTLVAGQVQVVELDVVRTRESRRAAANRGPIIQYLNFALTPEVGQGWSLVDASGKVLCQLPCKWSGTDPETLVVKHEDQVLPVRLGRKLEQRETMDVTVNPRRGSKGWALGVGIPSGVLFGASVVALSNSTYRTQTPLVISTSVFGAGFAACAWWFWWSKSRPYLDYDVPAATATSSKPAEKASVRVDWLGTGLGLSGTF